MKKKIICLLITLAVAVSVCCALALSAEADSSSGLNFSLNSDGNSYTVKAMNKSITTADIPSTFNGKPVTSIGGYAFSGCSKLTSVTIPNSVTSIGDYAFSGCSELTELSVGKGNTVYHSSGNCIIETKSKTLVAGCKTSVIPTDGSVTRIGYDAFYGCSKLTSITIPDSVTSIGNYAFYGCSKLTSVTIPNSVTSIGDGAFYGCSGLTSVTIPDINCFYNKKFSSVFSGYSNLRVTINDGVTRIGYEAFYGCSGLTSVTIPDSVTSIGNYAFDGCSGLTSVTIPNSVTSIGSSAFSGCTGLTSITIPNSVTSIGSSAFYDCSGLTSITIPDSVTSIGNYAFAGCKKLETIYFNGSEAKWNKISKYSYWDDGAGSETANGKYVVVFRFGEIISYLSDDDITLSLLADGNAAPVYQAVVSSGTKDSSGKYSASYFIEGVEAGTYTLRISKKNHVTREYTVTIGDDSLIQDVVINPVGDINGDGKITFVDVSRANLHYRGKALLTGYELLCADLDGNGKVSFVEVSRLNLHYRKKINLWTAI